jgi:hypothetical protein
VSRAPARRIEATVSSCRWVISWLVTLNDRRATLPAVIIPKMVSAISISTRVKPRWPGPRISRPAGTR